MSTTGPAPIEVRGLVKRYGELTAVAGVDLTVRTGDVYGYLGPNGAGKTTSLRMMLGLIRPTEGSVRLFGRDPMESVQALEGVAGFVEAPTFYPYLTARKNLEMLAAFDGGGAPERIDEALETVELTDRAKDKVGGYSHGMRQRLGIAAALLRDPKLLLLDEPATGLDPAGMRDMRLLIRRLADAGDDRAALEPPARPRSRTSATGWRSCARGGSSTRARSRRSSAAPAPPTGSRRPTTSGRWPYAGPSRASPTRGSTSTAGSPSRPTRPPPPSSRRRSSRPAR